MKKLLLVIVPALLLVVGGRVSAQEPPVPTVPQINGHAEGERHHVTPEQKQASDANMQAGLTALQSAASALQSSNASGAQSALTSAVQSMSAALGIYHGHRELALHAANAALKVLEKNGKNALARASMHVNKAIGDAQAALATN